MQRVCAGALLNTGRTTILNPGNSKDDLASLSVIQQLGATIHNDGQTLLIDSHGILPVSAEINCGESGLGLRMFAPIAAISSKFISIKGSGSLTNRPMHFFDEIFPILGITVSTNKGKLPITIQGPLHPKDISVDGSLSSQFLTGLLFAFAYACIAETKITVDNLVSKPYIDLTLKVLKDFGYNVTHHDHQEFIIQPATAYSRDRVISIEGDWSGAAFLLVAGAISGSITVSGVSTESAQADKAIIGALHKAGAEIINSGTSITIKRSALKGFQFDATNCPDLFPPLVALAVHCKGTTTLKGVSRLKHKESDRALTLKEEFEKMGASIIMDDDDMLIDCSTNICGAELSSHHDHRIAMACAVAALGATGSTVVTGAEAISKSYPEFYSHLQLCKASLEIVNDA